MNRNKQTKENRSGQAIIFLMVVMVIGLFVVLWNYDLHNTVSTKIRVGNAGDAGALAAARWQGITMNMIGELNLVQAAVILEDTSAPAYTQETLDAVDKIGELKDRLALNGPLMGFVAAQSAAFMNLQQKDENRIHDDAKNALMTRAQEFQASIGGLYHQRIDEPYPQAWGEYGDLLAAIAQGDMAIACGNPKYFLFYDGYHTLLDPYFYNAVASSYWCWFAENDRDLLTDYTDYGYWPSLPPLDERPPINSEYFGLDLQRETVSLNFLINRAETNLSLYYGRDDDDTLAGQFNSHVMTNQTIADSNADLLFWPDMMGNNTNFAWHFYEERSWFNSGEWNTEFIREGYRVKPEFDYRGGADAAVNIYLEPYSLSPGTIVDYDDVRWIAAAKPFGWLDVDDNSRERQLPHFFGLVLPAYHQARLIPNDNSSRPEGITAPGWDDHIYEHLYDYMAGGPQEVAGNGCFYCEQLQTWEEVEFRMRGDLWLQQYHENPATRDHCRDPRGGYVGQGGASDWR